VSREAKLLARIRENPRNVRPEELFEVLRAEGVTVNRHASSSHVGLSRGPVVMTLALPHGDGHLKTAYVVAALKTFGLDRAADVERKAERRHTPVHVQPAEDGGYVATVPSMPGCMTHGETRAEALANVEHAKACWLESSAD
jgi:predicted RNase H-like HicB family nuclease